MAAHLSYFEVLGLNAPPADRKAVKRAYSKKLKVTRPEDDPDGFMRLRDAHDLALKILARQAENAAWEAQKITVEATYAPGRTPEMTAEEPPELEPSLTYEDLLPEAAPEPEPSPDTSYAIGATPNLDAPPSPFTPPASEVPALLGTLDEMLGDQNLYNSRESWNVLFRKARQLDIDDYVDFEKLLLERILGFHGYYDQDTHHDTPEKMPRKLSPSITASLFKTMSWDQVNKLGHYRGQQIEWLERRMNLRKRVHDQVPIPETNSGGNGNVWAWLLGVFAVLKIIQLLANL